MINQWMITVDYIENGQANGRKSTGFKSGIKMPVRFKIYDDDMNLYFEGVMKEADFHPLDEFAAAYGCVHVKISEDGKPFTWL
ncbi:hypothetical protein [Desulfospira joergensenii]|uniref:hypothetical protein n=1 Tax=Desulfospira joergensenii TaxID=53329 RepID=UPI000409709A|nr:hypothetical protein [Desulfospira joergensenii]